MGGVFALDGLWRQLSIDTAMRRMLASTRMGPRVERIPFALVANRALAPSSKLAATRRIEHDLVIDGLDVPVVDESCHRAMDWLIDAEPELGQIVFDNTTDLLNLEVDLLFFDTTSTYFEIDDADAPRRPRLPRRHRRRRGGGEGDGVPHVRQVQGLAPGSAAGRGPAWPSTSPPASFYTAFLHGLSIQAGDRAARASLLAAVGCAMSAWDGLVVSAPT